MTPGPLFFSSENAQSPDLAFTVKTKGRTSGVGGGEISIGRVRNIAARPRLALMALLVLCLAVYLPGVVRLPPVDRTEVIYAETVRDMVARGAWADPRYGGVVHQFRPIGTFWAQGLAATLAGTGHARDITVYRLPGMLAVAFSVLALYWLTLPMIGVTAALITAGLFAVAPLTAVVANLAIAEGLSLLPATVAMLALLRLYVAPRDDDKRGLALLFWTALGFGMLINALLVPILVLAALIALWVFDRDVWWLGRLQAATGVAVALAIAAPWLVVRVLQDGMPFAGMGFKDFIEALGGAQDMKLRAWPGTFVLAAVLGFLPGTALLAPALLKLWNGRDGKIARFLLAWVIGYLVYLEALSSKPGTYMVQPLFPAFAIAVAMLVTAEDGKRPAPTYSVLPWPPLAALFAVVLFAVPYAVLREWPPLLLALPMLAVAALFYWSAAEGRAGRLKRWAGSGIAALGLFAVTLLGGILPSIDKIWPARQIQRAMAECPALPVAVLGFNEPTSRFVLNRDADLSSREGIGKIADGTAQGFAVISESWYSQNPRALTGEQTAKIRPLACLRAINTMRGCTLTLTVAGNASGPPCQPPPEFACSEEFKLQSASNGAVKPCD